eukprot:Sspe_Gene.89118::Locus_60968_Transcript_1_1_Confidence_1.000_Length_1860::g.89118::m.89118/K01197/hya; hyaluronoglucosaminidase
MIAAVLLAACLVGGEALPRYAVFWNVGETKDPPMPVEPFGILPRNYTEVGGGCSTPGCSSWSQGVWPVITSDGKVVNGGVPQAGNLTLHLETLRRDVVRWIPDPEWDGNAVFDFESWTTVWDYNSDSGNWHSRRYQDHSIALVREQHPTWNESQVLEAAKTAFESAATEWFVESLKTGRALRPKARWGFYGLPLNLANPCDTHMRCGYDDPLVGAKYRAYSDQQKPIWEASTALFPSIYLPSPPLPHTHAVSYVSNTVREALRCAGGRPVFPYVWLKYHSGKQLLNKTDLNTTFVVPQSMGVPGVVIWGSGSPGGDFWDFFNTTAGPFIRGVVQGAEECSRTRCSGHGRCTATACVCDVGYTGPSCTDS